MKKITAILLVMCLMCGALMLTSCTESTAEMISNAVKNTNELDSFEAEMEIDITMTAQGMEVSVPMSYDMKAKDLQTDKPIIGADVKTSMMGMKIDMEIYTDGEWAYISTGGAAEMSYKQKMDSPDFNYDMAGSAQSMVKEIPAELLENVEVKKNDDGSKTVELSISDEDFKELFEDVINDAAADSAGEADIDDIAIKNAKVSVTVADGYVKSYELSFDMDMEVEGTKMTAETEMSIEFKSYNKELTITPPEGYEKFEDYDKMGY